MTFFNITVFLKDSFDLTRNEDNDIEMGRSASMNSAEEALEGFFKQVF